MSDSDGGHRKEITNNYVVCAISPGRALEILGENLGWTGGEQATVKQARNIGNISANLANEFICQL